MKKNSLKAIVWDLDGTIIHFNIDVIRARKVTISILEKNGIPEGYLTIKNNISENIRNATIFYKKQNFNPKTIKRIIKKIDSEIIKIEHEAALTASKINDINIVLEFVRCCNLKQAIFTYNTYKNTIISLKKVNLIKYFDIIVGRDDVMNPKPHEEHLLFICKKLKLLPNEIIVVGDTSHDIECALNVGAKSIAINCEKPDFFKKDMFQYANLIIEQKNIPNDLIKAIKLFL